MAPVIDHTRFKSKQEWLDNYPEWSITGVSNFLYHNITNLQQHKQINATLYVLLNTVGPFILAYIFPSFIAPIIAMLIVYISYYYIIPLWSPNIVQQDQSVNTEYQPNQTELNHIQQQQQSRQSTISSIQINGKI